MNYTPQKQGRPVGTSFLFVEGVPSSDKGKWVRAAQAENMTLNEWVARELNKAAQLPVQPHEATQPKP